MKRVTFLLCCIIVLLISCKKSSDFSTVPNISYLSLSPLYWNAANLDPNQGPVLSFQLQDAEGDFNFQAGTDSSYVYVKNTSVYATDDSLYKYPFPDLSALTNKTNLDVKVDVLLNDLKQSPTMNTTDTFYFDIWVQDLAGHKSNVIRNPDPLILIKR